MSKKYRNRMIINQRGASISINNTTDEENIQISQRSGSNILLNNLVNSELATNNKQTIVINDQFDTVGKDSTEFVAKNKNIRTGENFVSLKGFVNKSQIQAFEKWKETYKPIALLNAQFKIKRGGVSLPNGDTTELEGTRDDNPVIGSDVFTVENKFAGYTGVPLRKSNLDEVATYVKVPNRVGESATIRKIKITDVQKSAGSSGSNAPGVLEFGANKSAATENGIWGINQKAQQINEEILKAQEQLTPIEQEMGNGGDEHLFTKRNKMETIGASFNDYPSVRIDEKGRSQPFEMLVSDTGIYKNHDYIPHVEEVDNASNFPCGQDIKIVGNHYSRNVGSGGISLKTTGSTELGGATLKAGFKKININASHGINIGSENGIELQSLKTITLRTNRQVYIESSLGVKNNLIVGGGLAVEGETYLQHLTGPLEVHQTEDTVVAGKFATDTDRTLFIAECEIGGQYYPVYARAANDLLVMYPHSHHFNNIAMTLTQSNSDVRKIAQNNSINAHNTIAQATPQLHEKKLALFIN
jgi:hypothetical protein